MAVSKRDSSAGEGNATMLCKDCEGKVVIARSLTSKREGAVPFLARSQSLQGVQRDEASKYGASCEWKRQFCHKADANLHFTFPELKLLSDMTSRHSVSFGLHKGPA